MGQIALAVVLAQAAWRLVTALVWYAIIPIIGKSLRGNTESVLFTGATTRPFPWDNLFGSLLEFTLTVILAFYLNRWIQRKPAPVTSENADPEYSSTGQALTDEEARGQETIPTPENIAR